MKKYNILIVEDAQNWQDNLRRILEREGYSVVIVGTYGEARTQLETMKFDLAIVDLRLRSVHIDNVEGMNVVAEAYRKGIRSIIVTAIPSLETAQRAFDEYAVLGFLDKEGTWNPDRFRDLVKQGLRQSENTQTTGTDGTTNISQGAISFVARQLISPRVSGVLDNILGSIFFALLLYVFGIWTETIKANPLDWFSNLPSMIYVILSVIAVLLFVLAYALWERTRRK